MLWGRQQHVRVDAAHAKGARTRQHARRAALQSTCAAASISQGSFCMHAAADCCNLGSRTGDCSGRGVHTGQLPGGGRGAAAAAAPVG